MTSKGSSAIEVILSTLEVKPLNLFVYLDVSGFRIVIRFDIIKNVVILLYL